MGTSLRMRRVGPDEVVKGAEYLESRFSETLKDDVFLQELEAGVLCNPGEDWQMVNVLLTGEDFPATGSECLPVLGGEHVATLGSPFDVLLVLKPELVRIASEFLQGVDTNALLEQHKGKLRVVGGAPDWMVSQLVGHIDAMKKFYLDASAAGQAVTKRVYG
ncbi:DUF1877 family protein [Streptomyces sp. V1I6]|uniref:DUF1877 family protein n=1 Tax=Streptomyces sp. V1I6 TaxID=3042273 RepID=UPI00278419E1|nr:DUF1877 family protein [Streptomyces sp. V1I6]MDQ0844624.1 hypothetical protein [Streptomyces sp. V1I6]